MSDKKLVVVIGKNSQVVLEAERLLVDAGFFVMDGYVPYPAGWRLWFLVHLLASDGVALCTPFDIEEDHPGLFTELMMASPKDCNKPIKTVDEWLA